MNNREFCDALFLALNSPTQYATGAFGAPTGYKNNTERYASNSSSSVAEKIKSAPDGTFLFDCIGLGKGILWGWNADPVARYGGAVYKSGEIPDMQIKKIEDYCDFYDDDECVDASIIIPGEILRTPKKDHVGFYVGNKEVIECTTLGDCKVRIVPLGLRDWEGHGTLRYIDYIYDTYNESGKEYKKIGQIVCPHCGSLVTLEWEA